MKYDISSKNTNTFIIIIIIIGFKNLYIDTNIYNCLCITKTTHTHTHTSPNYSIYVQYLSTFLHLYSPFILPLIHSIIHSSVHPSIHLLGVVYFTSSLRTPYLTL